MKAAALLFVLAAPAVLAAAPPAPSPAVPSGLELTTDARNILGPPAGPTLTGSVLDARTHEVSALLRCPVCQGLSVADSPSSAAQNMKHQVRDLLAAGYDGPQVLAYFERSYGEFVRLEPPLRGINWIVWLAPAAALIGGGFVLARMTRRRGAAAPAEAPAPVAEPAAPIDPALEKYRDRVRALAYGDAPAPPRQEPG
jgi:cytochrome c-type biogenesis protein CcmH